MASFPPSRILVGISCATDSASLSIAPADRHTFHEATWLAKSTGAQLRAVHVTDFVDDRISDGRSQVAELLQERLREQVEAMIGAARLERVAASMGFLSGKPWYELLREAHRWEADLIMVSPRRGEIGVGERLLHGSTCRRLLRKASCPVWTVRHDAERGEKVGVHAIVALVDGSEISSRIVAAANGIAEITGARKVALRSLDYPDDIALRRIPGAVASLNAYHNRVRDQAHAALLKLTGGSENGWEVRLADRWIPELVTPLVHEENFDLVVVGATSKARLAGVLLGTTAEKIIERAPVSTLVVRHQAWESPVRFEDP